MTHTVVHIMWTLAQVKPRVKNKPNTHKQTVTMATNHLKSLLTNIHVFSQLKQTKHLPVLGQLCHMHKSMHEVNDSSQ